MKSFNQYIAEDTMNESALKALRVATAAHSGQIQKKWRPVYQSS